MHEGTDQGTDPGEDGRWLTYRELAESRQIDRHSAVKLALKHGWRRQRDNHNVLRILVPVEWLAPRGRGMPKATDAAMPQGMPEGMAQGTDFTHAINTFDAALTALREQLERSEQGRDGERQRADALRDRIEGMTAELAAARDAADQARREAQAAAQAAEALRAAETERQARGLLARLRAAVRGR